ncbi:MAG: hypothetical protein ACFFAN_05520, partial [Promethearchaeota archaeon]
SNDPRYEIVIDSFFAFEFDYNSILPDSYLFDLYPNTHNEKFYFGNYSNAYNVSKVLECGEFLPIYYDDSSVNETLYFEAYDSRSNHYYFGEQLFANKISEGVYNITWNPFFGLKASSYSYFYKEYVDKYHYLHVSWADNNSWNEWRTIDQPNVIPESIEVAFEYYNSTIEDFETVYYNKSKYEYETRQVAMEYIYPYDIDLNTGTFELSQNYSNAQADLEIFSIQGYYFDESNLTFNVADSQIQSDWKSIQITAPSGCVLSDFQAIVIILTFTEGAYSDFTQLRLLDDALYAHPESQLWTKNDSLWVNFNYYGFDYQLLLEDYSVGSESSKFYYVDYLRNDKFIYQDENSNYTVDFSNQYADFESFVEINDYRSVLELYDFDLDAEYEVIVQKDDLLADGVYDSFKYGSMNSDGEILYHTAIQHVESTQLFTDKFEQTQYTDWYKLYLTESAFVNLWTEAYGDLKPYAKKTITTETSILQRIDRENLIIQKDLTGDGIADKELSYESIFSSIYSTTLEYETTDIAFIAKDANSYDCERDEYLKEKRTLTYDLHERSISIVFRDFIDGETVSTRAYDDVFPNELSELYNLEKYLETVIDASYDSGILIEVPSLEGLLSLSHSEDNVPAFFDQKITIENGQVLSENILATVEKISSINGVYSSVSGIGEKGESLEIDAIKVVPKEGIYYSNNWGYGPEKTDGHYVYFDGDGDASSFETIFVINDEGDVIGVAFDYDHDSRVVPNKHQLVERHLIKSKMSDEEVLSGY